jgi:hypothetical protein
MPSARDVAKDHALTIGSQLASIEDSIARTMSIVMQAAIHHQPGVLETAIREAEMIDDQATALVVDLRRMLGAMRA